MPKFRFFASDDPPGFVCDSVRLVSVKAAQAEALKLAGAIIKESPASFWEACSWELEVRDASNSVVFKLVLSGDEHPLTVFG